jgi:hypothetical protein
MAQAHTLPVAGLDALHRFGAVAIESSEASLQVVRRTCWSSGDPRCLERDLTVKDFRVIPPDALLRFGAAWTLGEPGVVGHELAHSTC